MVVEEELLVKLLNLDSNNIILEIMSNEGKFSNLFGERGRKVETIESDPALACLESLKSFRSRVHNHFVFCGSPQDFLRKKIDENAEVDTIIVNTDRLRCVEGIWRQIKILQPLLVIMTWTEERKGQRNKQFMTANGFEIIIKEEELKNGISEKFCVGCCSKCYSD